MGSGAIYVLPYHVANVRDSYNALVRTVLDAVSKDREGGANSVPEFLGEVRLPHEQKLLTEIEELKTRLSEKESTASLLRSYRMVLADASGSSLEGLVIKILNLILDGSGVVAEDGPDVGAEDFRLMSEDKPVALAETKGIGGYISRSNVNQVDNHRAESEYEVDEVPGVLIINVARNSEDLGTRQLDVSADVVRHAVRQNVLVLRTWDLFLLLSHHFAERDAAKTLLNALAQGGGWLEVGDESARLQTGAS